MVANILDAVSAYRKATDLPQVGAVMPTSGETPESFDSFMQKIAGGTVDQLHQAEAASQRAVLGKVSPVEIATAVAEAETSLQLLVTLREKMIAAYQEVTRMSV